MENSSAIKDIPSGLVDMEGREIHLDDKIQFGDDTSVEGVFAVAFEQGCFVAKYITGGGVEAMNPLVLRNFMETKEGRYISNYGNLVEYPNNRVDCLVIESAIRG